MVEHNVAYPDFLKRFGDGHIILVIGDDEPKLWLNTNTQAQVKVFRETQFAKEWPAHAAANAKTHIWFSSKIQVAMPPITAATIAYEKAA